MATCTVEIKFNAASEDTVYHEEGLAFLRRAVMGIFKEKASDVTFSLTDNALEVLGAPRKGVGYILRTVRNSAPTGSIQSITVDGDPRPV